MTLKTVFFAPFMLLLSACASVGGPDQATIEAWLAAQTKPDAAEAYGDYAVAHYAALTNDHDTAARRFASVIDEVPAALGVGERAVFTALLAGEFDQAVRLAGKSDAQGTIGALGELTQMVDQVRRGAYGTVPEEAAAIPFGPYNRMIAQSLSGWALYETDGADAAITALQTGLTGDKRLDSSQLYQIGFIELAAGRDADALETFESIWESGARLALGLEAHAALLARSGREADALEKINTFRKQVGVNAAIEALARQIKAGEPVDVRRYTASEGAARAIYVPAAALMAQTRDDVSGIYFVMALALDPDLHVGKALWAQALENSGRREDALALLESIPKDSPFYAAARGQMAWVLRRDGADDAALGVAAEALSSFPDRTLKVQLANLYRSLERYGEAELVLNEIITADKEAGQEDWRQYYARGAARERLGKWPLAEADFKTALTLEPGQPEVLNYLGYSYIDRGIKLDEGFELIKQAVAARPNSGFIVDSLGWGHYRMGRYGLAVQFLERAVALEPGDPVLNDHLGDAYWQIGRRLEARFQWQRALKLEPSDADRQKIEQKLDTGLPGAETVQAADITALSE